MGLGAPWAEVCPETHQKQQSPVVSINQSPTIHQNKSNLSNCLEYNQFIDGDR